MNLYHKKIQAKLSTVCLLFIITVFASTTPTLAFSQFTMPVAKVKVVDSVSEKSSKQKNFANENQIQFSYSTSDGGYQLHCTHGLVHNSTTDWQVVCGKGTATVKEFYVHLYIDQVKTNEQSKWIVFYSIHDRNIIETQFHSHFSIYRFAKNAQFISFEQSLGIENDAAYLNLSFSTK